MNKKLIIFYKSYVLKKIHERLVELNNILSIDKVDEILKYHAGFNTETSCKEMTKEDLQDPKINIEIARKLYNRSGWQPWTCFTAKLYQKFL